MDICPGCRQYKVFRKNSSLFQFLKNNSKEVKDESRRYRLSTIYLITEQIINRDCLFDPQNPEIVVCNQELEEVFDVKYFRRSELHDLIGEHLMNSDSSRLGSPRLCQKDIKSIFECRAFPPVPQLRHNAAEFDKEGSYLVSPAFMKALQETGKVTTQDRILPYRTICRLTSDYIMSKKCDLFDLRNIRIINVKNDQLSKVFNANYLSHSQMASFIRSQLKPVRRSKRLQKRILCV